jgi:ADP-ribose pyrophosphatase YjhB (NUDIX family)
MVYLGLRCFWFLFRPKSRGTLVAVWFEGHLLLVKNSYRRGYSLPGGNRRPGEKARNAAVREIREEVGLRLPPNRLRYCGTVVSQRNYVRDHCAYFEAHLQRPPRIHIDGREVVTAVFAAPGQWDRLTLSHQVRTYLERYHDRPRDQTGRRSRVRAKRL